MTPDDLFNAVFAPNLPYDDKTCEKLCAANYFLPKCKCFVSATAWKYSGSPEGIPVCPKVGKNCTSDWEKTNDSVFNACKCFKKCTNYQFRVVGLDKIRYSLGMSKKNFLKK